MADIETLRLFVNDRLTAVAEDILAVFVRTLVQYQQHIELQRTQLDDLINTPIKHHLSVSIPLDPVCKDEVSPGQQERSPTSRLVQEEQDSLQIKEEQELPQRPEEADGLSLPLLTAVKAEGSGKEDRETELLATSSSAEHTETQAYLEDGGASQPASGVLLLSSHCSESNTEDGDVWGEIREDRTAVNTMTQHPEGQRFCTMSSNLSQDHLTSNHTAYATTGPASDVMSLRCSVCGKVFGKTYNLRVHMMTHTGEKPFSCTICGKLFYHRGGLNRHMIIHTGEKRFSCTVCGKGFGLNANLKTHMRSHTGEKPFSCIICGKGFSLFANLKRHITTHTGEMIV